MSHRRACDHRKRRVLSASVIGALVLLNPAMPGPASADTVPPVGTPPTVSADALPTWQVNGVVWSQVLVRNTVYATGSFTRARPPGVTVGGPGEVDAVNIFAFDVTTGNRVAAFSHSLSAQGRVVAAAPDGSRVYVGGDFTAVDGSAHGHVAAFNTATGALDPKFTATVSNTVRALAAGSSTLFIGGAFGSVDGAGRSNLGAVSVGTGALSGWAPRTTGGSVWSMVLSPDHNRVVIGGAFTALNAQPAYGMGSVSSSSGTVQPWAANQTIRDATATGAITSLRTDGVHVFGSGFSTGAGSNFEGTFEADPNTGNITLVNDCHGDTYDVLPVGPVLYSVGHAHDCRAIGAFPDVSPRRWQHALAQTVAATGTNAGPDGYGWDYKGLPDSTVLQWFPQLGRGSYTGQSQAAWALAGNANYVVLGGEFPTVNGSAQQGLTRMAVKALAPNRRGPTYLTFPATPPPATAVASTSPGTATVTFGTAWDYDNELLNYEVIRDSATVVHTAGMKTNFWTLPTVSYTDTGLTPGSTHTYQVRISDPFGSRLLSPTSAQIRA